MLSGAAARLVAGRWIAGTRADDALKDAKSFNSRGIRVLLNNLGEAYRSKAKINSTISNYMYLISNISKMKLNAALSVKPSQLGLLVSEKELERNYLGIVRAARNNGIFVWLDMEEHDTVDSTIELYRRSIKYGNTGICIQSYLRRSMDDEKQIVGDGGTIRLVKGAYTEPRDIAFQSRAEVTKQYSGMMDYLFRHASAFMIATHDIDMVSKAMRLEKRSKKRAMLGMLKGIMNRKAVELAESGEDMNIYVPFGPDWIAYSYRRLTEAGHTSLILRSLMKRQSINA